ncbi:M23 family metallopeptidase [Oceaniglobus trochenteri]|uniref:M23 family metallopeptidase n=1 Tax=Oceaniglobus trochenteri TaxID=2763260 RepID=UPI001CFF6B87|nr:M23 family metallopeptidase [Oceaniglobus trochenteri]
MILLAAPAAARDPVLSLPLDCTLGKTCFIQQYTDSDPGPGAADYTCGPLSYDGHKGTDFALPSLAAVEAGVDVYPAAPGTVISVRDGMPDQLQNTRNAPDVTGRECGNGLVLRHGDGWETQYCHLKHHSVKVRKGQSVDTDTVIGQAGLSGNTEFPHLHLTVRKDGKVVDPFNADATAACGETRRHSLWQDTPPYRGGGMIAAGFSAGIPTYDAIRAGTSHIDEMHADSGALVLWGYAYGGRAGDEILLEIVGLDGPVLSERVTLEKAQAQFFRAMGRRRPDGGWPGGDYMGLVRLIRDGAEIGTLGAELAIIP